MSVYAHLYVYIIHNTYYVFVCTHNLFGSLMVEIVIIILISVFTDERLRLNELCKFTVKDEVVDPKLRAHIPLYPAFCSSVHHSMDILSSSFPLHRFLK